MAGENDNPVEAGQFLGNDGAFQDDWQGLAFPDDTDPHKTDQTLANIKDFRSMAKMVVSTQKQLGQLSGGREFAILPNEQSGDDEVKEYRTKIGVPETAGDYKLSEMALPEGLPKDEKLTEHMAEVLHKAGVPTKMATAIHNGYAEYIKSTLEAANTQEKLDAQEANKQLRGKLGAAYDKTLRDVAVMLNAFGGVIDAAETAELIKELPYDSFATQLLGKIAEKFGEGGLSQAAAAATGELTPANANAEIAKIQADPYYLTDRPTDKPANKAYHDELIAKVQRLTEIAVNKG